MPVSRPGLKSAPERSGMEHSGTGSSPSWVERRYLVREFTPWVGAPRSEPWEVVAVVGPVRVERRLVK